MTEVQSQTQSQTQATRKASKLLKAAKAFIADEKNWCKGDLAQDKYGDAVSPGDQIACKFCSLGALNMVVSHQNTQFQAEYATLISYIWQAVQVMGASPYITSFNDNHTHAEVMQMWDQAIKLAEADECSRL